MDSAFSRLATEALIGHEHNIEAPRCRAGGEFPALGGPVVVGGAIAALKHDRDPIASEPAELLEGPPVLLLPEVVHVHRPLVGVRALEFGRELELAPVAANLVAIAVALRQGALHCAEIGRASC